MVFLKNFFIAFICILIFNSGTSFAYANSTGFLSETVELSKSSIIEGEEVEISVSFANFEEKTLTGKITFYDGNIVLGSRELNLESGQTGEFIISWQASLGEHSFTAKAENLKLAGTSVAILGPSTSPKEILIGFKNSSVAEKLRQQGTFGSFVAGVIEETRDFFVPIIQSLDVWRDSKINPLQDTQDRIQIQKEEAGEKMKPIIVVHGLIIAMLLFIVTTKVVFFTLFVILLIWILSKIIKLFKRIIRKDYSEA